MKKYRKRFTKDEFKKELIDHTKSRPKDFSDADYSEYAEIKAQHYLEALAHLDDVANHIRKIASTHPENAAKKDADFAIYKLQESIAAYGDAVFDFNSNWIGISDAPPISTPEKEGDKKPYIGSALPTNT